MKHKRFLATLAIGALVGAVLLAMNFGLTHDARANQPNASLEFALHVGGCNTTGDQKGNCTVTQGSTFVASVSLDMIPGPGGGSEPQPKGWGMALGYHQTLPSTSASSSS